MWQFGIWSSYYPNGVSLCPHVARQQGIGIWFKCFLAGDWENMKDEFSFRTQALVANSNSVPFPQHNPLVHKRFLHSLVLGDVREYFKTTCALAPFFNTPMSFDTTLVFIALHPESNGYFLLFLKDYELNQDLEFSSNSFKLTFHRMSCMLISGLFRMVFEHLQDCFHPKDSASGFL